MDANADIFDWVTLSTRWQAAALLLLAYAGLCLGIWRRWRAGQKSPTPHTPPAPAVPNGGRTALATAGKPDTAAPWIVYASQSGLAEAWAQDTAQALRTGGSSVQLRTLDQLNLDDLQQARRMFFVVSTTGDGEPPDNALDFVRRCMRSEATAPAPTLPHLQFGLLALGDRDYPQFCAFGRRLDAWLRAAGAHASFDRIEVHQADPTALAQWRQAVARVSGHGAAAPAPAEAPFTRWRVVEQRRLNPGSAGQPLHRISLTPVSGALPNWQAGDLAQVLPPGGAGRPRDYSIANLCTDGHLELLVRRHVLSDGRMGLVSSWLTGALQLGDEIALRVRAHPGFRSDAPLSVPLILIGNGSGLAGLRAHVQQRARLLAGARSTGAPAPERCAWLVFGERTRAHDQLLPEELAAWQAAGVLTALDTVFSRDEPAAPYVQDRLRQRTQTPCATGYTTAPNCWCAAAAPAWAPVSTPPCARSWAATWWTT